jgi:hypothetical protein
MFGVSVAILATYLGVRFYKKYKKKRRISAEDLITNGVFDLISYNGSNVSTKLYQGYKNRNNLDSSIDGLVLSIEKSLHDRTKMIVNSYVKNLQELNQIRDQLIKEGKDPDTATLSRSFRAKRWFATIGNPIKWARKKYRLYKFNKEKKNFYQHVSGSKLLIDFNFQDDLGKKTIMNILQGGFVNSLHLKSPFKKEIKPIKDRSHLALTKLKKMNMKVSVKDLVESNTQRLLYTNTFSEKAISARWKQAFPEKDMEILRQKAGSLLKLRIGLFNNFFISNNVLAMKNKTMKFISKLKRKETKEYLKMAKNFLKNRLKIREKNITDDDILKFANIWAAYGMEINAQNIVQYQPTGMLEVVDKKTCLIERVFVCGVSSTFFFAHGHTDYLCPLKTCAELTGLDMIMTSNIEILKPKLEEYFKMEDFFY